MSRWHAANASAAVWGGYGGDRRDVADRLLPVPAGCGRAQAAFRGHRRTHRTQEFVHVWGRPILDSLHALAVVMVADDSLEYHQRPSA